MWFVVFISILLFNLAPAFTPPTWLVLSYLKVTLHPNSLLLALVGAVAATCGRLLLAGFASRILRRNFLKEKTVRNIDSLRAELQKRRGLTFSVFLFYAFSPLPSNQLFLAYGLTDLPPSLIAFPFFIGRFASYLFWITTASRFEQQVAADLFRQGGFWGLYFVVGQLLTLLMVYLFTKLDWHKLFTQKKIGWIK